MVLDEIAISHSKKYKLKEKLILLSPFQFFLHPCYFCCKYEHYEKGCAEMKLRWGAWDLGCDSGAEVRVVQSIPLEGSPL